MLWYMTDISKKTFIKKDPFSVFVKIGMLEKCVRDKSFFWCTVCDWGHSPYLCGKWWIYALMCVCTCQVDKPLMAFIFRLCERFWPVTHRTVTPLWSCWPRTFINPHIYYLYTMKVQNIHETSCFLLPLFIYNLLLLNSLQTKEFKQSENSRI